MADRPSNQQIADLLDRIAGLLEAQDANTFRVRAYRNGAERVRASEQPVAELASREGRSGLAELPDIGASLAGLIVEYVETGRASLLERLEGETTPEKVFAHVPGIGEALGQRIHDELGIATLEELEQAAHDGRLARVAGFGERRVDAVRSALAGMLSPSAQRRGRERAARGRAWPASRPANGRADPRARRRVPPASRGRPAQADRAAPLQPAGRGLAADPARRA
jgi:hypothetical protein